MINPLNHGGKTTGSEWENMHLPGPRLVVPVVYNKGRVGRENAKCSKMYPENYFISEINGSDK